MLSWPFFSIFWPIFRQASKSAGKDRQSCGKESRKKSKIREGSSDWAAKYIKASPESVPPAQCYLGYRYPAQNSCRVEFTTFDYYYKKYIVTYIEEYDDRGHELDSYNTNAGWEDVEANDGTFMGMLMQKAADNSSRDYQLLYYDPRTHPHKSHK